MQKVKAGKLALAFALGLFVCLMPVAGFAQAVSGDLVGTVVDASGAAVNGATVEATNAATGFKATANTKTNGEYRFTNLPVGRYNISASAANFSPATLQGVPVELNKTNTANLSLKVGEVTTTVEVSGEAPPIDTTTAQVQTTYSERQAQDLPTSGTGSGVLNLSLLNAGVTQATSIGAGSGPSVGGQRPRNNNFTVEGVDNNDKGVTGPQVYVPNDGVANFTILQNQYSPEFGHSSGGQFNTIISSGTNNWHGSVYDYLLNRHLNAMDRQAKLSGETENPRYDDNRFGFTFGGPIIKNKLFFFTNLEYNPHGETTTTPIFAPTAAGFATLGTIPGLSATNLGVFQTYVPAASAQDMNCGNSGAEACFTTVGGVNIPIGTVGIVPPVFQNRWAYVQSLDWNISDRDQFRGRYIFNKLDFSDTAIQLPAFLVTVPQRSHLINLSEFHTFSPNLSNEFRIGYNRTYQNWTVNNVAFPGLAQFPNLTIDELGVNIGPDPNSPQFSYQNTYQLIDNVSWTKGSHTFKLGGEVRKYISPQSFTQRSRGDYEYGSLEPFLMDLAPDAFGERSTGNWIYYGDQMATYWYANDQWRLNQHLTLNLGVRYEYTSTPFGQKIQGQNSVANPDTPISVPVSGNFAFESPRYPKNNWAPRIGIAYSPGTSGNTSIRAGFGMAYDILYDNIGLLSLPPQVSQTTDVDTSGTCVAPSPACPYTTTGFLANGGLPAGTGSGFTQLDPVTARAFTANWIPPDVKLPYSIQWNLGIQHSFGRAYSFEVRYLGTRGIHLPVQNRPNVQALVNATNALPTYLTAPDQATLDALPNSLESLTAGSNILPQFEAAGFTGNVFAIQPLGWSTYHGLQTQFNRRFENGLQFQAAYTWSHTIDNSTADFFSTVITPRRPQDFQCWSCEKSNSALDRRHRVSVAAIYDMPFFKNSNWLLKNVIGNWEIAPVYTYESPQYGTVQSTTDANLNGDNAGDRAFLNPKGQAGVGSDVTPLLNTAGQTVAYVAVNPNAQYITAGDGTLPSGRFTTVGPDGLIVAGRNTIATNPINNWDVNLSKRISFSERYRIELGARAFNLFNKHQYLPGYLNDVASNGIATSVARNFLTPSSQNFNQADQVFTSNPRQIQLVAKFIF